MEVDLKIYSGYANAREIVVMGHVFKKYAPDVFDLDKRWYKHAWAVIRMFSIKTIANTDIIFRFGNLEVKTKTLEDGYFRITIPYEEKLDSGWHDFTIETRVEGVVKREKGEFVKPYAGEYGVISDIDDTFLISHSGNIFKKLYVLLTKNINKRHVFEEVVEHYRLLNRIGRKDKETNNAFFYVSSSEWNLYNFIIQFTRLHQFPKAVLHLKKIKMGIADFLFTGGGDHNHKFYKIKHLVEFYPELRFVLLGDDSQQDPFIYENISKIFPENISTVYIRKTRKRKSKEKVAKALANMEQMGIRVCYFRSSTEAMQHTREYLG
ncbi:Phosphatidate phosphatase APP1 [Sinomicrobium oceani]|uniref:Phosphatidate phosphatase APP1 n=1 Tax=Sinomicrobium oceani TaxID=1150368 RepID=A0A1K1LND2_9FLAO|nr:App1 family protein [Sinomicrobium oceani]SFW12405.1 Phosphatidate phosphatase APP1 [Sinomicrobium oceani]